MNKHFVLAALAALPLFATLPARAADLDDESYSRLRDPRIVRDDRVETRHGDWREHRPSRGIVEARGSYATDYLPYHVAEWRARRSAIEAWKLKVENIFGPRFAQWRESSAKRIDCERAGRGAVECSVSARPERSEGGRRWGSWNWRRTNY